MTKNKKNSKNKTQKQKASQRRQLNGGMESRAMSRGSVWGASVLDPFSNPPVSIPDDRTMFSGNCTSRLYQVISAEGDTESTNHNFAVLVNPYPLHAMCALRQVGTAGVVSDVRADGSQTPSWAVPNYDAMVGEAAMIRCTGIGVKVNYLGTELNRAGRVSMGLIPIVFNARTLGGAGKQLSQVSTLMDTGEPNVSNIINFMKARTVGRISDGTMKYSWRPNGCPSYQATDSSDFLPAAADINTSYPGTVYEAPMGGNGFQAGQNVLVIAITGDHTTESQEVSGEYSFDVVWHWEIIPSNPTSIAYPLTSSHYDPLALAAALNSFGKGTNSDTPLQNDNYTVRPAGTKGTTPTPTSGYLERGMRYLIETGIPVAANNYFGAAAPTQRMITL
nr:hypothetical protein [Tolivirales sp.]